MKFETHKYFWLIFLVIITLGLSTQMPITYALGVITGAIVKDGIIFTLLLWSVMTGLLKKPKWKWYEWLNYLVIVTFVATLLYYIFFN